MLDAIHEYVLRLDVPMRDGKHEQIVESPEDLVRVDLDEHRIDFPLFDSLVQIIRVVIHDYVQVLIFALIGDEALLHH